MNQKYSINGVMIYLKNINLSILACSSIFFISATAPDLLLAAEFQGALYSVSITEAAEVNTPPIAKFSYTQIDNTFTFDAGESSDPDGNITKYIWSFSDGNSGTGQTYQYTPNDHTSITATLTVLDNSGNVTLRQKSIHISSNVIFDNFNTDTTEDYISISKGIEISNGQALGTSNWYTNIVEHKTSTHSNNHYVEAACEYDGHSYTGILLRYNGTTGYATQLTSEGITLNIINNGQLKWIAAFPKKVSIESNKKYKILVTVTDAIFKSFIDLNNDGEYTANETLGEIIDSQHTKGERIGLIFNYGYGQNTLGIDMLSAAAVDN